MSKVFCGGCGALSQFGALKCFNCDATFYKGFVNSITNSTTSSVTNKHNEPTFDETTKQKWPRLHVDNWILRIDEPGQTEVMSVEEHEALLEAEKVKTKDEKKNYEECLKTLTAVTYRRKEVEKKAKAFAKALMEIENLGFRPKAYGDQDCWNIQAVRAREALADWQDDEC